MHEAVVTKLSEHLSEISAEGDVEKSVVKCNAPNENFVAEDSFQQSRCAADSPPQQRPRAELQRVCAGAITTATSACGSA